MKCTLLLAVLASAAACSVEEAPQAPHADTFESLGLDLEDPEDRQTAFLKTRGSLDPEEETFFYWTGSIFVQQDADPFGSAMNDFPGPVLHFDGFNVARFGEDGGDIRMITREVAVYRDLDGEIIDCWWNAPTGASPSSQVRDAHVWNDPVNFTIPVPEHDVVDGRVVWRTEVMLNYTNPLPVDDYPDYSAGNTYQSAEMFNWFVDFEDLDDASIDSAPVHISWSRVGQFVPWMQAGQTPGRLIYHTHGRKLLGGFSELPQDLQEFVLERDPSFQNAPEADVSPNMTSWRVFKQAVDSGSYTPTCD